MTKAITNMKTLKLKQTNALPVSLWPLIDKELKAKSTRDVQFATGSKTYITVEFMNNGVVQIAEVAKDLLEISR